jgi:two-component system sensor histidine kinase SenX3
MTTTAWLITAFAFAAGAFVGIVVFRRRAKREVVARTLVPHRTRQIVSALQSGAVVVRRDRRAAFSNTAAAALGIARPDGALHPAVADLAEEAWDAQRVVEREIDVARGVLGSPTTVHVRVTPLDLDLALAVANDNTEARAAEATRREFAVNVSHELKTPVGALALLAESIEAGAEDPKMVREFSAKIRRESRRLSKLIQEIIEISRLQGGESVVDHEEVSLVAVAMEAIEGARVTAESKDIRVETVFKSQPTVVGDRDLLVMAVRNLIDNAVAYSDPGKRVTLALESHDGVAALSVLDQGIGIDPKDAERVFERFYRADPARSRETGGTGLGLSIVKHVAARHGGTVDLWSQPAIGSTFTLKLPVHQEGP